MFGWEHWNWNFWWIFPLFGIFMMMACMFMMHRSGGMRGCCMPRSSSTKKDPGRVSESSAEEILKARYARGEISRSEYEEILRDVTKNERNQQ